ncbi:MAG TPA: hypothetical protein PLJ60_01125 [Chryseolinea sp.]|nr:hypothetical protein [Chryseolinea sp.]HPH45680.1 hypothetical protein [Chryseolinea sp.]HPM28908.1 hypothetical protein [Chryseolinea sp.]
MRRILISIFLLSVSNFGLSQEFKGEGSLPPVEADGFYRIFISPKVSPYFNSEFSNIRIYDQQNTEVPYLFQKEDPVYHSEKFKEYEIVEKKKEKNCCTSLILKNPDGHAINNINLSIKNAEVTKRATLLGSDDRENWFALKEHFILNAINNQNKTSELKIVDFPLSNYTFYLLQLEDSTSAPINILSAGYYEANTEDGKYEELSSLSLIKSDSTKQKKSFVKITLDTARVVDKLTLSMSGQPYFLRRASLYSKEQGKNKKGNTEYYYDRLYDFELSSKQTSVIALSGIKVKELLLIVENDDNPPLDVASIRAFQVNRYVTAWLKRGNQYSLKIGRDNLQLPNYDLAFFKDKIPAQPPLLYIGAVAIFQNKVEQSGTTIFTSQSIIWIAIVLVIIILGFMSVKLIRETGNSNKVN